MNLIQIFFLCLFICFPNAVNSKVESSIHLIRSYNFGDIHVENKNNNTILSIRRQNDTKFIIHFEVKFGKNLDIHNIAKGFRITGNGPAVNITIEENRSDFILVRASRQILNNVKYADCIDLQTGQVSWYGGPQNYHQYYPLEKMTFFNYSYLPKNEDYAAVAERYWLNSKGGFIYVDKSAPLFINQNVNNNTLCLSVENRLPYNTRRKTMSFDYYVGVGLNAKKSHLEAIEKFLKKPKGLPDLRMIQHPIWSTWARYKRPIDEKIVYKFVEEILFHKFNNSQVEIDDDWEVCYGAMKFNQKKFPSIQNSTVQWKGKGFRVTLWVHPFINIDCEPIFSEAMNKGFIVSDHNKRPYIQWWNSGKDKAVHIDFTKPKAVDWFIERLKLLQNIDGIDSFKFDAGETSWAPSDPVLNAPIEDHPIALTSDYVRAVSKFGSMIETRAAHQTQDLPIFLRMMDKDTRWTFENGLPTLITTLLQLNMVGYPFVLPDMIGGNGYNENPSKELFIRWLQVNTFMPSLQFSYVPWDYDNETIEISRKFTDFHARIALIIVAEMKRTIETGEPLNPPIWWLDPDDRVAQQISDEYLLGSEILVAPVIERGATTRDIYLPKGNWFNEQSKKFYKGPKWLMGYPAPLDTLPYFIQKRSIHLFEMAERKKSFKF